MTTGNFRFCPQCATALVERVEPEDGGPRARLRCPACAWTHWNNPTPVLAAIVEVDGKVLLASNASWTHRRFALITGFMEAGESPEEGIAREIAEETSLVTDEVTLLGVHEFLRQNQIIITYHARCHGEVRLSPELVEYGLFALEDVKCWSSGTGLALAAWLRSRGHEPEFVEFPTAPPPSPHDQGDRK
jgi:NADH pyrophosphatase NudC (nudix superfamily)